MQARTKFTLGVVSVGVAVSVALAVAAALTLGAGSEHGPGLTTSSIIFAVMFFVLNPLHFLWLVGPWQKMPELLFWSVAVIIDLGWWFLVGSAIRVFLRRRKHV